MLTIKAGRLRQSAQTGFVHHCYEQCERGWETIPVYENFCFALALFRTKTVENVLEAKALLERLFAFQTSQGFPIYLHEFPQCKSRKIQQKLSVVAQFLLRDFSSILGTELKHRLESLVYPLEKIDPRTPEEWADYLIQSQLSGEDSSAILRWWDGKARCFTGPQRQERGEPAVTLLDLIMGEWTGAFSARALLDHSVHLQASLIFENRLSVSEPSRSWSRRFWGTGSPTHSALLHTSGSLIEEGDKLIIDLPEKDVQEEMEISYFINRHPGARFLVSGCPATTFQLGETLTVESGGETFQLTFVGEGKFWGHLHLGNRSHHTDSKHSAFDRVISLRTIERTKAARIEMHFRLISN